jgi:arabinogalactan endo-1,4-beta-galactosidase
MVLQNIVALLGIILPSVFFGENISNQGAAGPGVELVITPYTTTFFSDGKDKAEIMVRPSACQRLEKEKLEDTLRSYTREVISALKSQGTTPDMVQIGNEINHGMVWPDGHIGNPDELARLIKAGVAGVKDVDPSVIIMLHIALGGYQDTIKILILSNTPRLKRRLTI